MNRITSGSPELDRILGGGFPRYSINMIMGLPGTGKTILAQRAVFANATPESPALYIGTVSEPVDKMLRYVQGFDFFDSGLIGSAVIYQDLSNAVRTSGLPAFVKGVIDLIKEYQPRILVIDSFKGLHSFSSGEEEFRRHITELMIALSSLSITSLLVGEYDSSDVAVLPEFAIADGIIELVLKKVGVRDVRYLRVIKERGSSFLAGEHAFRIGESGLSVFPRLVTDGNQDTYTVSGERAPTGVEVLDTMVSDGFWKGSSTIVFGPPGCGKTLMGLHFIFKGIELGEKALIATMQENPTQLRRIMARFGWDLDAAIESGMLELLYMSPVDIYIDEFVATVAEAAKRRGVSRLMIDSLNDLLAGSPDESRFRDFMYSLVQYLSEQGVSTYMTHEVTGLFSTSVLSQHGISHMSDNVVLIHYVRQQSEIKRAVSVVKTRGSAHDERIRQFHITNDGISIGDVFETLDFRLTS